MNQPRPSLSSGPASGGISNRRWPIVLFIFLLLFFQTLSILWLLLNKAPTRWDDSWFLTDSLTMFDALADHGVKGWLGTFFHQAQLGLKAPLMCALPTPIYLIFGRDAQYAFAVNLLFMVMLLASLWGIVRHYWGEAVALMAVFITATMPQIFSLSTWYLAEYGLAALVAFAIWCLIKSRHLREPGWTALFSLACGLGVLQKILFPVYLAPLLLYCVVRRLMQPAGAIRELATTAAALVLPALIVGGPWYVVNYRTAVARAIFSGFSHQEADKYGTGPPFTYIAIQRYLFKVINEGIGAGYFCLAVLVVFALLAVKIFGATKRNVAERSRRLDRAVLLIAWGLPFAVFVFGNNKEVRFVAPLLPVFAILMASGLARLVRAVGRLGYAVAAIGLLLPLGFLVQNCFQPLGTRIMVVGTAGHDRHNSAVGLHFLDTNYEIRVYEKDRWPLQKMLMDLIAIQPPPRGQMLNVIIGSDSPHFNSNNLQLAAKQACLPVMVRTTAYYSDPQSLEKDVANAAFFLVRAGGEKPAPASKKLFNVAWNQVQFSGRFENWNTNIVFPDGGVLSVYRNAAATGGCADRAFMPAALSDAEPCRVRFAEEFGGRPVDLIELDGFTAQRRGTMLSMIMHWRCLAPPPRQYRLFVHVLDGSGKIIALLDRDFADSVPPMNNWQVGDSLWEAYSYNLAMLEKVPTVRIDLGFYDPTSGRPPLTASLPEPQAGLEPTPGDIGVRFDLPR